MTMLRDVDGAIDPARTSTSRAQPCAVVWIDDRSARLAMLDDAGQVSTCEIDRGSEREQTYLAVVVRAIGPRRRLVILGPGSMRVALEHAYVVRHHRPGRLVDVEPCGPIEVRDLLRRLRELAADELP